MTTKSESSKWMDNLIKDYVSPLLKEEGFKKRGRIFHKASEDIIKILEIQHGGNSPSSAAFTINLIIVFPGLWDVIAGSPRPENPMKIDSTVQQRIGLLLPRPIDKWWYLKKASAVDAVGPEVISVITDFALPFLKKASSARDLLALFVQNPENWGLNPWRALHAAIIANYLGDNRHARSLLLDLLDGMSNNTSVRETTVCSDGASAFKEKSLSKAENIRFVHQCAERMGIDLQHPPTGAENLPSAGQGRTR